MNKTVIGILLITIVAIVSITSLSYYIASQPNQTSNTPTPASTSSPTPTPSPSETPTDASTPIPSVPEFTATLNNGEGVRVEIKNQPEYEIYYNIRVKEHFSENWTELYHNLVEAANLPDEYPRQSESQYTTLSFTVDYPTGRQVDVQVEAIVGVWLRPGAALTTTSVPAEFVTETSGWSETQTVTIS